MLLNLQYVCGRSAYLPSLSFHGLFDFNYCFNNDIIKYQSRLIWSFKIAGSIRVGIHVMSCVFFFKKNFVSCVLKIYSTSFILFWDEKRVKLNKD